MSSETSTLGHLALPRLNILSTSYFRRYRVVVQAHATSFMKHGEAGMRSGPTSLTYIMTEEFEMGSANWVSAQVERIFAEGTTKGVQVMGRPVVLITMIGAKSGNKRYVPLMRVEDRGRYAIVGSKGGDAAHPSWYFNVKAHPAVSLQDGERVFSLTARELAGDERDEWWQRAVAAYPTYAELQTKTSRLIPVFVLE